MVPLPWRFALCHHTGEDILNKTVELALAATLAALTMTGCSLEARSEYRSAGFKAEAAGHDAGKAIGTDAKLVGHSIADAWNHAGNGDDKTSARIRNAIVTAPDIQTSDLKVCTNGSMVTLRGSVATEVQNQSAEHIARATLGRAYKVDDQLRVNSQD